MSSGEGHDFVTCRECDKKFRQINSNHLKCKHGMTIAEYQEKYPDSVLISSKTRFRLSVGIQAVTPRGDASPCKRPEVRQKISGTLLEFYQTPEGLENRQEKSQRLIGVSPSISRRRKTSLGVTRYFQSEEGQRMKEHLRNVALKWWEDLWADEEEYEEYCGKIRLWFAKNPDEAHRVAAIARASNKHWRDTGIERKIHAVLHKLGVEHMRWLQCSISICKGEELVQVNKEFDFYLPVSKVFIEADGCYWHGCPVCWRSDPVDIRVAMGDAQVENICRDAGLKLLRFWEHDIFHNSEYVETRILSECLGVEKCA